MDNDNTLLFNVESINEKLIYETLKEVYKLLEERGYNASDQIVGYILSGDLGYISNYKDARNKMNTLDRSTILETMLKKFLS